MNSRYENAQTQANMVTPFSFLWGLSKSRIELAHALLRTNIPPHKIRDALEGLCWYGYKENGRKLIQKWFKKECPNGKERADTLIEKAKEKLKEFDHPMQEERPRIVQQDFVTHQQKNNCFSDRRQIKPRIVLQRSVSMQNASNSTRWQRKNNNEYHPYENTKFFTCKLCKIFSHAGVYKPSNRPGFMPSTEITDHSTIPTVSAKQYNASTVIRTGPAENHSAQPTFPQTSNVRGVRILVVGESGVGKTTFINGLRLYQVYKDFESAKPQLIIGSAFMCMDAKFTEKFVVRTKGMHVKTGEQPNTGGESSTKRIMDYLVYRSETLELFCIDTPGIHDTGGIEVDQCNTDQLAAYINQGTFQTIDAICILMKPNIARIGPEVRYCFDNLLKLPKSAIPNLFFCFTNAPRGPGDSLSALGTFLHNISAQSGVKIRLTKENCFSFDNSCIRYLCMMHANDKLRSPDLDHMSSTAWLNNVRATNNLLETIRRKNPVKTAEISNLTNAEKIAGVIIQDVRQRGLPYENLNLMEELTEISVIIQIFLEQNSLLYKPDGFYALLKENFMLEVSSFCC